MIVPVKNEADNILPLVEEIHAALAGRCDFEIVYVDDGSTDATPQRLAEAQHRFPALRVIRHRVSCGQSTALASAVRAARHPWVATLDGDCQNDPADIPALLERLAAARTQDNLQMLAGWRAQRRDAWLRRLSSRVANGVRGRLLRDGTPDTGCGLKVFSREAFLRLPHFDHMHRFLPALIQRGGGGVESVIVRHRPRMRGSSKYGLFDRLWVGIVDLAGVGWLMARSRRPEVIDG